MQREDKRSKLFGIRHMLQKNMCSIHTTTLRRLQDRAGKGMCGGGRAGWLAGCQWSGTGAAGVTVP